MNILQGVTVTNAGSTAKHHDGMNVSGGTVNIAVSAGQAATSFSNNTQHGIYVTGTAVVNIAGVPGHLAGAERAGDGHGEQQRLRRPGDLRERAAPRRRARSSVWSPGATRKQGIQLFGGEKVKVRRSVLLNNKLNGLFMTASDSSAASNDLSGINLGIAGDPGLNQIQASLGANADLTGLCVSMATGQGTLSLSAQGNVFAGPTDCTTLDQRHHARHFLLEQRRPRHRPRQRHDRRRRPHELPLGGRRAPQREYGCERASDLGLQTSGSESEFRRSGSDPRPAA